MSKAYVVNGFYGRGQTRAADTLALGIFEQKTLDVPVPGAPEVLYKGGPYGMNGCSGSCGCGGKCGGMGDDTSILYKFGMSPRIWGAVALAGAGLLYYKSKKKRRR